jgi:hypothetical protein
MSSVQLREVIMSQTTTFSFPTVLRDSFNTKLEKINRKLSKMKHGQAVEIISENITDGVIQVEGKSVMVPFDNIIITLPFQTKYPGFEYVGTINIEGDTTTYFSPKNVNLTSLTTSKCDHCGCNRKRKRLHVFSKDGNLVQVGSKCMEDFIGVSIDSALNCFLKLDEDLIVPTGYWGTYFTSMDSILQPTLELYKTCNDYMKNDYMGNGTTSKVKGFIHQQKRHGAINVDTSDLKTLLTTTYKDADKNDNFKANVHNALINDKKELREMVPVKSIGFIIWAAYHVMNEQKRNKISTKLNILNEYLSGNIGDKISEKVTILKKSWSTTIYGETALIQMITDKGNRIKTFTSGKFTKVEPGDKITLQAVIKKHEEWKSTKSTLVNRPKLVEVL